ncbi:hypothetical protein C7974DRAFT_422003 [Boeremia exigua]|uniref:uncharacterized protein n=1 Tax=Boeremia exigua TaxID=749465 RepID=UPI001E8ECFE2|nr:uncharacterized protein C7974DRAFT_422003 [Boeremia exigua]KAH6639446.1 hypothetical protein C7974DRAFT_422003 [Boeremia exigua]
MAAPRVVPAQLSFLAIYSPALGDSDATFHEQIVFYYAKAAAARAGLSSAHAETARQLRDEENEKLRQVGLAQGMVGFARAFARGETVDAIDTDKARIVLHELEPGWWILASVDLTQLPAAADPAAVEYSSREVSPAALLVQQLVRAHGLFTLHHGWPLQQLFEKHPRDKFCSILRTYWGRFCAHWDVLLHASPAVDMFNGLKLAAGGELGMGVGEEEWGSSERDVLEDFARRTEGLVDVLVSRFGTASPLQDSKGAALSDDAPAQPWIGSGGTVEATDGVVFSGVGGLSRASRRDVSHWTESIFHYGDHAYGIRDNPTSGRTKRRRRNPDAREPDPAPKSPAEESLSSPSVDKSLSSADRSKSSADRSKSSADRSKSPADKPQSPSDTLPPADTSPTDKSPPIPPPIVRAVESSLDKASQAVDNANGTEPAAKHDGHMLASLGDTETWMKYMTLGYGTAWGGKKTPEPSPQPAPQPTPADATKQSDATKEPPAMRYVEPAPDVDLVEAKRRAQVQAENDGYFLIGLKGDMIAADMDDENDEGNWNARIPLRTIYVEKVVKGSSVSESDGTQSDEARSGTDSKPKAKLSKQRLQPVIYVHRPFIYTFLFTHRTPSLTIASFYRSIHAFFAPLHRSLDRNTSPTRVAQRLLAAQHPQTTTSSSAAHGPNTAPIYDLVWDPRTLTLHSSLPNIPAPGSLLAEGLSPDAAWSRPDALNVHAHILASLADTRRNAAADIERSSKTARGWWVVWMRVPPSTPAPGDPDERASRPSSASTVRESHDNSAASANSTAFNTADVREAFLVRRARDAQPAAAREGKRGASGVWGSMGLGGLGVGLGIGGESQSQRMGGRAAGWGPKGLGEGIGVDARRYVDEVLSLNR